MKWLRTHIFIGCPNVSLLEENKYEGVLHMLLLDKTLHLLSLDETLYLS